MSKQQLRQVLLPVASCKSLEREETCEGKLSKFCVRHSDVEPPLMFHKFAMVTHFKTRVCDVGYWAVMTASLSSLVTGTR